MGLARETGTRHVPGIQPADIDELIAHGASAVERSARNFGSGLSRNLKALAEAGDRDQVLQIEAGGSASTNSATFFLPPAD